MVLDKSCLLLLITNDQIGPPPGPVILGENLCLDEIFRFKRPFFDPFSISPLNGVESESNREAPLRMRRGV